MSGIRLAVFASGGGTNLQALIDHFNGGEDGLPRVALVLSDREDAGALERARAADVPSQVVQAHNRSPDEVAAAMLEVLEDADVDLVALAGYTRLVPATVVRRFAGRMLNIHPALLPSFGGKGLYGERVHEAVLDAGCAVTGATVHYVDEGYDTGRILAQWPVPVLPGDTADTLAARVLTVEHLLYPAAIERVARDLEIDEPPVEPEPVRAAEPSAFHLRTGHSPADSEMRRALGLEATGHAADQT